MDLRDQKFGLEIEMTGISRDHAAEVISKHFNTRSSFIGGTYRQYQVRDREGRIWKVMWDSSIMPQEKIQNHKVRTNEDHAVEVVSPICRYEDIKEIQQIVRKLRKAGGFVNQSCGIHVHVDASKHDARSLRNIINIIYSKEDLIFKTLQVDERRKNRFCKEVDDSFLKKVNAKKPKTKEAFARLWYEGNMDRRLTHYDSSRYHALNLHSVFQKGTVEFRMFNSTLHAGMVKTYIQFSLAISAQAINQRKASRIKTVSTNERYTFRTWLLRLGMKGDEFATARKLLLKNLEGNIAWKDPAQAEAQKERLKAKSEEQRQLPSSSVIAQTEDVSEEMQPGIMSMHQR